MTRDFQQCGILTSVDSDEPVHPPFKLRNSKLYSVSNLILTENSSDLQRLWSVCAYAQADLRLCWLHIPYCFEISCRGLIMVSTLNTVINKRDRSEPKVFSYSTLAILAGNMNTLKCRIVIPKCFC